MPPLLTSCATSEILLRICKEGFIRFILVDGDMDRCTNPNLVMVLADGVMKLLIDSTWKKELTMITSNAVVVTFSVRIYFLRRKEI